MLIAVTGSSGKLGTAVTRELLAAGYDVLPLDSKPAKHADLPPTGVVDLTNPDAVRDALKGVDAICHLGNIPGFGDEHGGAGFANNVNSTFNVFHAAGQLGIPCVVNASSIQAYGCVKNYPEEKAIAPQYLPIDEDHPLLACNPYGLSKAMGESIAEAHARRRPELCAFSLRFTYISMGEPAHVPVLSAMKTFIGIADAARAVRLCVESDRKGHTPLNIAAPISTPAWNEEDLVSAYGWVPEFRRPLSATEPLVCCKKAQELLGCTASATDFQKP